MSLLSAAFLGGDWIAATHSSLGVIYKSGRPMMFHYLRQMFTSTPPALQADHPLTALRSLAEGLVIGLGQGLPVSATGQSFAWPYLAQRAAVLPGGEVGAWAVCLLAAAVGLALLLRGAWRRLAGGPAGGRHAGASAEGTESPGAGTGDSDEPATGTGRPALRASFTWAVGALARPTGGVPAADEAFPPGSPTEAGAPAAAATAAPWVTLLLAIVPCWLLQARLGAWGLQFEAAAAVGLLLVVTGLVLQAGDRWALGRPPVNGDDRLPLWLALVGGVLAGFGALPGLSALAVLLVAGLYGRLSAETAGRFALMATTGVLALQGLVGLPSALLHFRATFLLLGMAAGIGAWAGGWLLLALLRVTRYRLLPAMASYCTAMGGILLLFGVLQR